MHASRIDAGPTAVTKSWGVHNSYTYYMQGGDRRPSENLAVPTPCILYGRVIEMKCGYKITFESNIIGRVNVIKEMRR